MNHESKNVFTRILRLWVFMYSVFFLAACAGIETQDTLTSGSADGNKNIFVLFDGTANDPSQPTNVWRLYTLIQKDEASNNFTRYVAGVGTANKPITGLALGRGMEERILSGYEFVAKHYSPGDSVYIFGFSRGAHQARALAGFISYTGVPDNYSTVKGFGKTANNMIEIAKEQADDTYETSWRNWKPGDDPFLSQEVEDELGIKVQPVNIALLGLWDTVPGSAFKDFSECKEEADSKAGDRYKSGSYPTIQKISHAVSIDEKRSKFTPLLTCEAINENFTDRREVWFPGAHADVGGGYAGSFELPNISLRWMIEEIQAVYTGTIETKEITGEPSGLAHWSIGDRPANTGSKCKDRILPDNAVVHESVAARVDSGKVPLQVKGEIVERVYPLSCSDVDDSWNR